MIPFEMVVLDKLVYRSPRVVLTQRNDSVEAFFFDRSNEPFSIRVGVSSRLHRLRAVRDKLSGLPIPTIHCVAGRFSYSIAV